MITVAIVTRRLKPGKTYDDFRQAWFHDTGFDKNSKLYTMVNAFDPQEITVIGFTEMTQAAFEKTLDIDIVEQSENPLGNTVDVKSIDRKFGLLVAEDDLSREDDVSYKPATLQGNAVDMAKFADELDAVAAAIRVASEKSTSSKDK